ncbi:hypothetical protein SCHPADRAFT_739621 [Schizopora paradoxa]|uniref:Uncharacterized protein n=1 Tax=Schizopora paradoxa TaxID=27342 RepID=A0A0H2R018_9AGAM|nr:hypothetical protein SCHPADRAFT_739621 [Schizopora paradoxa]
MARRVPLHATSAMVSLGASPRTFVMPTSLPRRYDSYLRDLTEPPDASFGTFDETALSDSSVMTPPTDGYPCGATLRMTMFSAQNADLHFALAFHCCVAECSFMKYTQLAHRDRTRSAQFHNEATLRRTVTRKASAYMA